jgi:UDPglucose 6-dehydrogenase
LSHENHFVDVVSNPEFLREGYAVEDFLKPDRIVIGSSSARATEIMTKLYKPFVRQGNPIYIMDERSSEMTKYAANSFLALKISFMNEVANLCEKVGANVDFVRKGIGADSRIGNRFLFPGIGYGGSCFPKDVKALHNTAKSSDYQFKILESVIEVNDLQRQRFIQKVFEHLPIDQNTKIAIWGLAFKPNTDDIREAPALNVIESLLSKTKHISVFDPEAMNHVKKKFPEVHYGDNLYEILDGASALLILTEWQNFRTPNFKLIKEKMKQPLIFDGRNVFELEDMEKEGFQYFSIGRKAINKS